MSGNKWDRDTTDDSFVPDAMATIERTGNVLQAAEFYLRDQPVDARRWRIEFQPNGNLHLYAINDAKSFVTVLIIERTGMIIVAL